MPEPVQPTGAQAPAASRDFYRRDAVTLAKALLGQRLVRVLDGQRLSGLIVETEAYLGAADQAAHTYQGRRTQRNASMFLDGGHAYVYFTYGMHHCMNVVAGVEDEPVAVLIRAIDPQEGLAAMWPRRAAARKATDLCSGPAKLCQALDIDRRLNGADLVEGSALSIEQVRQRALPAGQITAAPRIGVDYAGEWARRELRFFVKGNPHVSRS